LNNYELLKEGFLPCSQLVLVMLFKLLAATNGPHLQDIILTASVSIIL